MMLSSSFSATPSSSAQAQQRQGSVYRLVTREGDQVVGLNQSGNGAAVHTDVESDNRIIDGVRRFVGLNGENSTVIHDSATHDVLLVTGAEHQQLQGILHAHTHQAYANTAGNHTYPALEAQYALNQYKLQLSKQATNLDITPVKQNPELFPTHRMEDEKAERLLTNIGASLANYHANKLQSELTSPQALGPRLVNAAEICDLNRVRGDVANEIHRSSNGLAEGDFPLQVMVPDRNSKLQAAPATPPAYNPAPQAQASAATPPLASYALAQPNTQGATLAAASTTAQLQQDAATPQPKAQSTLPAALPVASTPQAAAPAADAANTLSYGSTFSPLA
jgi:hypothetical protein